jgi:hypothetical protein
MTINNNCSSEIIFEIIVGNEALHFLNQKEVIKDWELLFNVCSVKSVFQSHAFVLGWYNIYIKQHIPLVIMGKSVQGNLVGLFTLAVMDHDLGQLSKKSKIRIEGAGYNFAIYQMWLCLEQFKFSFFELGIKTLFNQYPYAKVYLRYIFLDFLFYPGNKSTFINKNLVIEKFKNPILDFKKKSNEILGKRSLRSKYNRVSKVGKYEFVKVTDLDLFELGLEAITKFTDIRQGAVFNRSPFEVDPLQKYIFFDWFKKGLLHVTFQYLNGDLISAVICISDDDFCHLAGLISFSPLHSKFSPGLVHVYMLSQMLQNEGFSQFKLTPGYDLYKEKFKNEEEYLYGIFISQNRIQRFKRKLRVNFNCFLLKLNVRPSLFYLNIKKRKKWLKNRVNNVLTGRVFNDFNKQKNLFKIIKILEGGFNGNKFELVENQLGHLLFFNDYEFEVTRWEFLSDALKRLENGNSFWVLLKEDKMIACIWGDKTNSHDGDEKYNIARYYLSTLFFKIEF